MPLVLSLRAPLDLSVEVESLHPANLRTMSSAEVARLPVAQGNRTLSVGELFDIERTGDDDVLVLRGDTGRLKRIGEGLQSGSIIVEGPAGMHVGAQMKGGKIVVCGAADDWAGAEMRGGRLTIQGPAGNCLGAGYRGSRKGMRGGEIFVHGHAGTEVGTSLRRGLIAVAGDVGHACGFGMLAGSIVVFGRTALQLGAGMKRGTIVCLESTSPPELLPTFRQAADYQPTFLRGLLLHLRRADLAVTSEHLDSLYRRFCGDLLELGSGEILARVPTE